jgi:hypothetical protein
MNSLDEIISAILRDYAVDGIVKSKGESWAVVNDDELTFRINFSENYLTHCISVDNRKCFNKDSQCPIHFTLDLSRRKKERLNQALKYLRTKEGERDSATFSFGGFDEFDYHVRDEFYRNS